MDMALAAARFFHIAALVMLFGAALFPFYAHNKSEPNNWPEGGKLKTLHLGAALVALAGAIAWFLLTTANITGSMAPDALWRVAYDTQFGNIWTVRTLLLALLAVPLALVAHSRKAAWVEMLLAATLLVTLALTSHARSSDGLHLAADIVHLLAAGAWLGGLLPLAFALTSGDNSHEMLLRFSTMGLVAVLSLVATGLINALYLVGSARALFGTGYGFVLVLKLVLFGLMLTCAFMNRFRLMPRLAAGDDKAHFMLIKMVVAEQSFGIALLAVVALLGTMEPAVSTFGSFP